MKDQKSFALVAVSTLVAVVVPASLWLGCSRGSTNVEQYLTALASKLDALQSETSNLSNQLTSGSQQVTALVTKLDGVRDEIKTIQLTALANKLDALQSETGTLSSQVTSGFQQLTALVAKLDGIRDDLKKIQSDLSVAEDVSDLDGSETVEIHTLADAQNALDKLGKTPNAQNLADVLAVVDSWVIVPEQEADCRDYKLKLLSQLRQKVRDEVIALQKAALQAASGADGAKKHAEAGAILALYPMSDDNAVIEEAKRLSSQQAELAVRLEVLRRQRYNHWAAKQIEVAVDGYHKNKSYSSPKDENPHLMDSLVKALGQVDPAILEPVVLELYNYVVDLTKSNISEADKVELAKRMSDPSITRKTLGDF